MGDDHMVDPVELEKAESGDGVRYARVHLSEVQRSRLARLAATPGGRSVSRSVERRYVFLIIVGFVRRGPLPARDNGGRLVSARKLFITEAGRAALENKV